MCPPAAKYNNRRDQGYTLQAFLTSSVPVASALFLLRAADAPRGIALVAFSLVVSSLSLRRLVHRILLHHNFRQKPRVRNLLIVGTGEKERRLMAHIRRWTKGAMTVKGLVDDTGSEWWSPSKSIDIVCQVDTLFEDAKRLAVDEIYFIAPVDPQLVQIVTPQARIHGVGLRVVPKLCVELDSRTGAQMNAEGGVYECTWPACTICDR
jgi:FlaA1/EpsC-like NDP-sugar epimerase